MYEMLSKRISDDRELLVKIPENKAQPVPNLFLASVNYLLSKNLDHDLAQFYPNYGAKKPIEDMYPAFRNFCFSRMKEIEALMATRLVQTNEVRRCALLLPAVSIVAAHTKNAPLHLVDVGASSGLNLLMDQYLIIYSDGSSLGKAGSPVELNCEINGKPPAELAPPVVATRTGIDLNPIDLADEDEALWACSLIWPDQADRIDRFKKAILVLRTNPPKLIKGSGLEQLTPVIAGIPNDSSVCVLHSFTLNQFSKENRENFEAVLANSSLHHDIWRISLEWLGSEDPELMLEHFVRGKKVSSQKLASCHQHGAWIHWAII